MGGWFDDIPAIDCASFSLLAWAPDNSSEAMSWQSVGLLFLSAVVGAAITQLVNYLVHVWYRPILKIDFEESKPGFRLSTLEEENGKRYDAFYYNVRVTNRGKKTAKNARGFLIRIEYIDGGTVHATDYCDNLPLAWSYRTDEDAQKGIDLPSSTPQFLNVLSTRNAAIASGFRPATVPPTLRPSLYRFEDPGVFRFTIMVVAEDAEPRWIGLRVKWDGDWKSIWDNDCKDFRVFQDTTIDYP